MTALTNFGYFLNAISKNFFYFTFSNFLKYLNDVYVSIMFNNLTIL